MPERKYNFERLTPIDNVKMDVYEDAINYAFDNPDIKNVAITGAYSAGKSSVLASYKKKHKKLKFMHISLAHFESLNQNNKNDTKESVLEGKILNQLMHQIPSDKIPQTNFRVKQKVNVSSVISSTAEFVLFIVSIAFFVYFNAWKNYLYTLPNNCLKCILMLTTHQYLIIMA